MVIDSSAIMAILLGEADADELAIALVADSNRWISAVTALESAIVIEARKGPAGARELDLLFHHAEIEVIPMDVDQVALARSAWRRYGKGRHRANLNLGDCCSYALARSSGEPLLCKGDDFVHTDLHLVKLA